MRRRLRNPSFIDLHSRREAHNLATYQGENEWLIGVDTYLNVPIVGGGKPSVGNQYPCVFGDQKHRREPLVYIPEEFGRLYPRPTPNPDWLQFLASASRQSSVDGDLDFVTGSYGTVRVGSWTQAAGAISPDLIRIRDGKIYVPDRDTSSGRAIDTLHRYPNVFLAESEASYGSPGAILDVVVMGDRLYLAEWDTAPNNTVHIIAAAIFDAGSDTPRVRSRLTCLNLDLEIVWQSAWITTEAFLWRPCIAVLGETVAVRSVRKTALQAFHGIMFFDSSDDGELISSGNLPVNPPAWTPMGLFLTGQEPLASPTQPDRFSLERLTTYGGSFNRFDVYHPAQQDTIAPQINTHTRPRWSNSPSSRPLNYREFNQTFNLVAAGSIFVPGGDDLPELIGIDGTGTVAWRREGWSQGSSYKEYYTPILHNRNRLLVRTKRLRIREGSYTWPVGKYDFQASDNTQEWVQTGLVPLSWRIFDKEESFHDVVSMVDGSLLVRKKLTPFSPVLSYEALPIGSAALSNQFIPQGDPFPAPLQGYSKPDFYPNSSGGTPGAGQPATGASFLINGQTNAAQRQTFVYGINGSDGSETWTWTWAVDPVTTERDVPCLHSETRASASADGSTIVFGPENWAVASTRTYNYRDQNGTEHLGQYPGDRSLGWVYGFDWDLNFVFAHGIPIVGTNVNFSNVLCQRDNVATINHRQDNYGWMRSFSTIDGALDHEAYYSVLVNSSAAHEGQADETLAACGDFALTVDRNFLLSFQL